MPGTADIVMSKGDPVPAPMEIISLMSKTGKKNYERMYIYIHTHNSSINVYHCRI